MSIYSDDALFTVAETAVKLGISESRVRKLCEQGILDAQHEGRSIFIGARSIWAYKQSTRKSGRPFSESNALAALTMVSGIRPDWISPKTRYRIRNILMRVDAEELLALCRKRAEPHRYWCSESRLQEVLRNVRMSSGTGVLADEFGLVRVSDIEGYVSQDELDRLVKENRLREKWNRSNVLLHVTEHTLDPADGPMPIGVCAADLAESLAIREKYAGLEKLDALLRRFKDVV